MLTAPVGLHFLFTRDGIHSLRATLSPCSTFRHFRAAPCFLHLVSFPNSHLLTSASPIAPPKPNTANADVDAADRSPCRPLPTPILPLVSFTCVCLRLACWSSSYLPNRLLHHRGFRRPPLASPNNDRRCSCAAPDYSCICLMLKDLPTLVPALYSTVADDSRRGELLAHCHSCERTVVPVERRIAYSA